MSSFTKDKKQVDSSIVINNIEDNKESELNIISNTNPGSVVVSETSVDTDKKEDSAVNVSKETQDAITKPSITEIKSEELLDIVLNTSITSDIIVNTDSSSQKQNEKDLLAYNNKSSNTINTFTKNVDIKTEKTSIKKADAGSSNEKVNNHISKNENLNKNSSKSKIKTTIKAPSNKHCKTTKNKDIKDIKNLKINIENSKKYIREAAQSFKDYQLPKVVTNALFVIVLMFVACISLIISINNRNKGHLNTGIVKKTYISPIYEGSPAKTLGAFSQSTMESIASPVETPKADSASSMQILNEIAQLQNAVSVDVNASATIDSANVSEVASAEDKKTKDEEAAKIERLNYLLKSYVIISPSVDASVNQVFYDYFDSRMNVDIEKYLSLFGYDTTKINIESFSGLKKTFEYERSLVGMITNVKIYICNGFEANEKICFVNYDMLLRYANALVPSVFYANIALEGDRYIIKSELDKYRQIYVDHIIKHDEIKSLNYNVQTRLTKVLESNDFARLVYVSLRDKQIKIEEQRSQDNDEYGSYIIQKQGGVFSTSEPVNKVVLNDLRAQVPYDSIPSYHGLLTDPLLR